MLPFCFYSLGCFKENVGLVGDPVLDADGEKVFFEDIPNRSSCRKKCQENAECNFWVWKTKNAKVGAKTCWLKKSAGEVVTEKNGKPIENSIAGAKEGCDLSAIEDPDL